MVSLARTSRNDDASPSGGAKAPSPRERPPTTPRRRQQGNLLSFFGPRKRTTPTPKTKDPKPALVSDRPPAVVVVSKPTAKTETAPRHKKVASPKRKTIATSKTKEETKKTKTKEVRSATKRRRVIVSSDEENEQEEEEEEDDDYEDVEGDDESESSMDYDEDNDDDREETPESPAPKKSRPTTTKKKVQSVPKTNVSPSPSPPAASPPSSRPAAAGVKKRSAATTSSPWGCLRPMRASDATTPKRVRAGGGPSAAGRSANAWTGSPSPQAMFDDMVRRAAVAGRPVDRLRERLRARPLRVATMCSGTESPVLALDMIAAALTSSSSDPTPVAMSHVFSCEIEPFKQAYIERNFSPPLLFRDVRELGRDRAVTAYGASERVPNEPGDVDVLVAGTSCVDYSNLNNEKKTIQEKGESGQTFRGLEEWIRKARPAVVILENVKGAPWDLKQRRIGDLGYHATYSYFDTKHYYIPHTRQRGYLFALREDLGTPSVLERWRAVVRSLERPADARLDDFVLPPDDSRVRRGRARSRPADPDAAGRVDWTRCETRHLHARSSEDLGQGRPLTGWAEGSRTTAPSLVWNDWLDAQVHRVHDLMDVNTLRLAKEGTDATHKTMVWNLSQNVDRDTMGKLGTCQCLTPTGVPYVTNRGGPLVGEELLSLQGIPSGDLLLTRMTEDQLKDLAGNAMTTTVVGACTLAALLVAEGATAIDRRTDDDGVGTALPPLVPRELAPEDGEVEVTEDAAEYETRPLDLGAPAQVDVRSLTRRAAESARACRAEDGGDEVVDDLVRCTACGATESARDAFPPRRFEEHDYERSGTPPTRTNPRTFRKALMDALPMRVRFEGAGDDVVDERFTKRFREVVGAEYRFSSVDRGRSWTVAYASDQGRLELRLVPRSSSESSSCRLEWWLFDKDDSSHAAPLARCLVSDPSDATSLLAGEWEVCSPTSESVALTVEGSEPVESWEARLGLKGGFESTKRWGRVRISCDDDRFRDCEGDYVLLPKCGGACGSLHRHATNPDLWLFLESGRCTKPEEDRYVVSNDPHRRGPAHYRPVRLLLDKSWRQSTKAATVVRAVPDGVWTAVPGLRPVDVRDDASVVAPVAAPRVGGDWRRAPTLAAATAPFPVDSDLHRRCEGRWTAVNLSKCASTTRRLRFLTSRVDLPPALSGWIPLDAAAPCARCAPPEPRVRWTVAARGRERTLTPAEDPREAGAYERAVKTRPAPFKLSLRCDDGVLRLRIGGNPAASARRARAALPNDDDDARTTTLDWRVVPHEDLSAASLRFPELRLTSNRRDAPADQPPHFTDHPLRPEQLRSLAWMRRRETGDDDDDDPFYEEEVVEATLPSLGWRMEGRARRPVDVRGGVVADEVGYGKTAITIGLIDARNAERNVADVDARGLLRANATLVVVPTHLMGQWPAEVRKFVGTALTVVEIKDMSSLNRLTANDLAAADIVVVNFGVLSGDAYFRRLARLAGVDASHIKGKDGGRGGRYFEHVYRECVKGLPKRVQEIRDDSLSAYDNVEADASRNEARTTDDDHREVGIRLDRKKAVYKNVSEAQTKVETHVEEKDDDDHEKKNKKKRTKSRQSSSLSSADRDPWKLRSKAVRDDIGRMSCPPLEMFFWNRVVVDEFHYLFEKADRSRVLSLVLGLRSTHRWCLSGTPPHESFQDVRALSRMLGVHLGVEDVFAPGAPRTRRRAAANADRTAAERFSDLLEDRSTQWHERRHARAQEFLDRFVRQNVAEIDEILSEERLETIVLPTAERAVYLELETHLRSLEMNRKKALRSKRTAKGDRETRMQKVLEGSEDAEEALLKRCAHFDSSDDADAAETCDRIAATRNAQKEECAKDLLDNLVSALAQRKRICRLHRDWEGTKHNDKGEVQDRLAMYVDDVERRKSVSGGADDEVHEELLSLLNRARAVDPPVDVVDPRYADVGLADASFKDARAREEAVFAAKYALREHVHEIRALGKELRGRVRSLRYFFNVLRSRTPEGRAALRDENDVDGPVGVSSVCGHAGCLRRMEACADRGACVEPSCQANVGRSNLVSVSDLGDDGDTATKRGAKLTAVAAKIREIVDGGDRVLVFVQFQDLKRRVAEALEADGVRALQVRGTVRDRVRALEVLQKETPAADDPRVLLLTMDDESSAGVNLTTCNHAVFVHPLLADTNQQYRAYETQAIGRVKRYGQNKTVHVWRFLAKDTIDTEIFEKETGKTVAEYSQRP